MCAENAPNSDPILSTRPYIIHGHPLPSTRAVPLIICSVSPFLKSTQLKTKSSYIQWLPMGHLHLWGSIFKGSDKIIQIILHPCNWVLTNSHTRLLTNHSVHKTIYIYVKLLVTRQSFASMIVVKLWLTTNSFKFNHCIHSIIQDM